MNDFILNSTYLGVFISIISYLIGLKIQKKLKLSILNPFFIATVLTIIILLVFRIDYKVYNESAKYLTYLLTPVTICLAVPLYEQISILKKHYKAILISIFTGVMVSAVSILLMSILFKITHTQYVTLLPKSITTAVGIGVSKELGGIEAITVASITVTGILGNLIANLILKLFKIKSPIAKGLALGTSAHAIGTAKAIELGEIEGAMSGLSIAVAGVMTVVVASIFSMIY